MHDLEAEKKEIFDDPEKLGVLFKEMIQMCLWYTHSLLGQYWSYVLLILLCCRGNATVGSTFRMS